METMRASKVVPKIALFDLDGTVTNMGPFMTKALPMAHDAYQSAKGWLKNMFGRESTPAQRKPSKAPWQLSIVRKILSPDIRKGFNNVAQFFEKRGIDTGVVSNGYAENWGCPLVTEYGLKDIFDNYVFREHLKEQNGHIKPHPYGILQAMKKWDRHFGKDDVVFYTGDEDTDMLAAVNANNETPYTIVPVAIGIDTRAAKKLREMWQDGRINDGIIFNDYAEYLDYLKSALTIQKEAKALNTLTPAPVAA